MEFIIKEYGGIIILLICFSIAISFISAFLTKCESMKTHCSCFVLPLTS